jgi:hypothetical protein
MDKTGDRATEVEQRVHFNSCLRASKIGPRKQRKTQIDCGAVKSIDRVVKIKPDVVVGIEFARATDQDGGKIMPHAPVALFVRVGQRGLCDRITKSHAVEF